MCMHLLMYYPVGCFYYLNHTRKHLLQITEQTVCFSSLEYILMKLIRLQGSLKLFKEKGFTTQFKATF